MPSKAETALMALQSALASIAGVTVMRNTPVDAAIKVTGAGLVIVRDGEPGEPEMVLNPVTYHFEHMAEVEIFYSSARGQLDAGFDDLRQAVGAAMYVDRTLGGAVMWSEPMAAVALDLPNLTEMPVKAASLPVKLVYVTDNPLT